MRCLYSTLTDWATFYPMRLVLFPVLLPFFWREMTVSLCSAAAGRVYVYAGASVLPSRLHTAAAHTWLAGAVWRCIDCECGNPHARCLPPLLLQSGGYAWWETAAVMGTQASLCVFNAWFLIASWRRHR